MKIKKVEDFEIIQESNEIAIKELIVPNENIKSCSYDEILKTDAVELWTDSICLLQKIKR